jgi:toxin YoeB
MRLAWYEDAWNDYVWWQTQDRKTLKRINALIKDVQRSPFVGIGKPEPLKINLGGWLSSRIDETNWLVYKVKDEVIIIAECKTHYDG